MGRWKENFSLYPRKFKSGKVVWYYRTYSPTGKRCTGISTHQTSKTMARKYCEDLYRSGNLYRGEGTLFKVFANDFFNPDGDYMKSRLDAKSLSHNYAPKKTQILNGYVMPFFADYKINSITKEDVIEFRNALRRTRKLSNSSINDYVGCLSIILDYAVKQDILIKNPVHNIEWLEENYKVRDSFTIDEIKEIVRNKHMSKRKYICNIVVSALTGMRISETCAIDKDCVKDHYIDLTRQYNRNVYCPLKTKNTRKIPLGDKLYEYVLEHIDDFKNNSSGITTPFKEGILKYVREYDKERNLCFHSLRHSFNTYMIAQNINPNKVAAVMGHSTGVSSMQDRYTNFKVEDYKEIMEEQTKLFLYIFD